MTRDPGREAALLRARVRRLEDALRLAVEVLTAARPDDPVRGWLAAMMDPGAGEPSAPPPDDQGR